jgi:4-amino-4-deoxy-L-arabinose transferase-like glycosyltransferase
VKEPKTLLLATGLLLLAFALRLAIFDYGLPYVDNVDEPNFYLLANDWRGALDGGWRNSWLEGYPPAYILVYSLILNLLDSFSDLSVHTDMGVYVGVMRLVSILADCLSLAWILQFSHRYGSRRVMLFLGAIYALSPVVLTLAVDAVPDPLLTFFVLGSSILGFEALKQNNARLALLSTLVGLVAIAFKYSVAPVLLLPFIFFLRSLWQERLRTIPFASLALALVLGTAFALYQYGAFNLGNAEASQARGQFLTKLLDIEQWQVIGSAVVAILGWPLILILAIAYVIYLIPSKKKLESLNFLLLFQAFLILAVVVIYHAKDNLPIRYIWAGAALLFLAASPSLENLLKQQKWLWLSFILAIAFMIPMLLSVLDSYNRPMTFTLMQPWVEANLPEQSSIWIEDFRAYRSLQRYEGGYSGYRNFNMIYASDHRNWQGQPSDVDYIYMTGEALADFPLARNWPEISNFTLIKHFDNTGLFGSELYFFTTDPVAGQSQINWHLGNERLILSGIELNYEGGNILVNSYWQSPSGLSRDYSYTLYLTAVDEPATPLAQADSGFGQRPTSQWDDPEEVLRGEITPFNPSLEAGEYQVWLGIYYWETGERFILDDGSSAFDLGTIQISN